MKHPRSQDEAPLVVHVVPSLLRRGAQRYANDLLEQLEADGSDYRHELLLLFQAPDVPGGRSVAAAGSASLRRAGFDPSALVRLRRELVARRPAIVVAHGGEPHKYAVLSGVRVPVVYLKIGQAAPRARRALRTHWHRWLVRRADVVVAVSDDVAAEAIADFGADRSSVRVIPNGRDPEVFRPDPDRALHDPPSVVFVGHMTATKRPHLFLDVLGRLRERQVVARGRMIGDGELLDEVRDRGRRLGVDVLGGRDDVAAQLAAADLLLFTSTPEGEGMPGVLIEAAMCGLPVVTTRVAGASEVVVHDRTGLIVDPDDVEGLVRACASVLSDRDRWTSMGVQARERALERFSLPAGAARWERLFHELAADDTRTTS